MVKELKTNNMPRVKKSAYKMKGSPMQRNFGIGSPLHDETLKKSDKASTSNIVQADEGYNKMKSTKGGDKARIAAITERYGGTWSKNTSGQYVNKNNQTVSDAEETYLDASKNEG